MWYVVHYGDQVCFGINSHKVLRDVDLFLALFYLHCLDIVTPSLHQFVISVLTNPFMISYEKNTFLMIVSKVDQPQVLTQFLPIAICNMTYKLMTKIVINLNNIISPRQSSFILGKNIHHNIIIAHEMVHAMKRVKENKMFMLIKFI